MRAGADRAPERSGPMRDVIAGIVDEELRRLPQRWREALELELSNEFDTAASAELLGIPPARLHYFGTRARRRLFGRLRARGLPHSDEGFEEILRARPIPPPSEGLRERLGAFAWIVPRGRTAERIRGGAFAMLVLGILALTPSHRSRLVRPGAAFGDPICTDPSHRHAVGEAERAFRARAQGVQSFPAISLTPARVREKVGDPREKIGR